MTTPPCSLVLDYDMEEEDGRFGLVQYGVVQSSCTAHPDWSSGDLRGENTAREAFDDHVHCQGWLVRHPCSLRL